MTILWNEVTIWCNKVTKGWNEVAWNKVVMEQSGHRYVKCEDEVHADDSESLFERWMN